MTSSRHVWSVGTRTPVRVSSLRYVSANQGDRERYHCAPYNRSFEAIVCRSEQRGRDAKNCWKWEPLLHTMQHATNLNSARASIWKARSTPGDKHQTTPLPRDLIIIVIITLMMMIIINREIGDREWVSEAGCCCCCGCDGDECCMLTLRDHCLRRRQQRGNASGNPL